MITINETRQSLRIDLGGSVTTTELSYYVVYEQNSAAKQLPEMVPVGGSTTGATEATMVQGSNGSTKVVKFISVYNSDTANAEVTIKYAITGVTDRTLFKSTLLPGERIEYIEGCGFRVFAVNGAEKTDAGDVSYGEYTPTLTNIANLDSSSALGVSRWFRIGNIVTVSGAVTVDATAAAGTTTTLNVSLPIASDLAGSSGELSGSGVGSVSGDNEPVTVIGNNATDTAQLNWRSLTTAAHSLVYMFSYTVQ